MPQKILDVPGMSPRYHSKLPHPNSEASSNLLDISPIQRWQSGTETDAYPLGMTNITKGQITMFSG